ncbi:methyl-accepting chemotaxis protein [Pseudodesulfovibrio sediminis]|uniref:Methyl-accepting transducer domain-containing protein n=1 Tax=Pseudodesulfovibrio sediminis TaxID=2810563 RepID=A0ABN6ERV6_9BACT|nr:methyl-accepting chemotaxis protein [Pseudodesulfovibrio sediminis]BCS87955.1 hypothetical protein PSDVSF_11970 [Pseudodesulfovibrio sediminis]
MTKQIVAGLVVVGLLLACGLYFSGSVVGVALHVGAIVLLLGFVLLQQIKCDKERVAAMQQVGQLVEMDFSSSEESLKKNLHPKLADKIDRLRDALVHKIGISEAMINNIMTPMVVVELCGTIKWINESTLKLLEKDGVPEDFIGSNFSMFFYGDNRETVTERCMKEDKKLFAKTEVTGSKGTVKYISVAASPIYDLQGKLVGGFTTIMDFTNVVLKERHITEQNTRIANGVEEASKISEQVARSSDKIRSEVAVSSTGMQEQRDRVEEVATAMMEMNQTILEVAKNAGGAAEVARQTQDIARSGSGLVNEMIQVMDEVNSKAVNLRKEMGALGKHSQGISSIMQVISDIADQTNLLALNAAIEAARAGEAGRGFSVVADEIRKLAEKTLHATKNVSEFISAIQGSSDKSIQATDETVQSIEQVSEMCDEAGKSLQEILDCSRDTASQVESIATASEEQSSASEEINRAVDSVNLIAGETAESMETVAHSVDDLANLAAKLDENMHGMQGED